MKKRFWLKVPLFAGFGMLAVAAFSGVVMLLWNNTVSPVFHVGAVTIWQAGGILLLSKILFGGFRGRMGMKGFIWKKKMHMMWHNMTPEQKEQMRNNMHQCGGRWKTQSAAA